LHIAAFRDFVTQSKEKVCHFLIVKVYGIIRREKVCPVINGGPWRKGGETRGLLPGERAGRR
jgi:hypothetical protein